MFGLVAFLVMGPIASLREAGRHVAEAEDAKKPLLDKIAVSGAKFYRETNSFSTEPTIELTVRNNTGKPIKKLYFHGKLQTPGRTLPWVEDDFNYEPPGGLEPGETQTWKLTPTFFHDFYDAQPRNDAKFTVTVTNVDFAE